MDSSFEAVKKLVEQGKEISSSLKRILVNFQEKSSKNDFSEAIKLLEETGDNFEKVGEKLNKLEEDKVRSIESFILQSDSENNWFEQLKEKFGIGKS
ncbi:hypothetical protein ACN4EK_14005 [Pantanalinema rosaneae CENA516]|uniref:hypothetical protein n=1 Tax=Pantanalinema rosaneae TaxID=1620701 RepID=UPI003D6F6BC9